MQELQAFGVVVTTYQRLTNEQPNWAESPLACIYWLRMVLVRFFVRSCQAVQRELYESNRRVLWSNSSIVIQYDMIISLIIRGMFVLSAWCMKQ